MEDSKTPDSSLNDGTRLHYEGVHLQEGTEGSRMEDPLYCKTSKWPDVHRTVVGKVGSRSSDLLQVNGLLRR